MRTDHLRHQSVSYEVDAKSSNMRLKSNARANNKWSKIQQQELQKFAREEQSDAISKKHKKPHVFSTIKKLFC